MFISWADTKSDTDILSALSDQAALLNPAFTIYPGDLESDGFTPGGMDEWKKAMNGQLTGDTSSNGMFDIAFPVRGNHDDRNTVDWQAYFDFQATANLVGATNYTNRPGEEDLTYSFDYENAHFIGVDVTGNASAITSDQITWIHTDLAAAEARGLTHAFIYFHGPIYCVDGHCDCNERVCSIDTSVEDLIVVINQHPIVSATFHGHEHTYAHTYIDETRIPPDGAFEGVTHPFHQFVTGSAGAGPTSCEPALRCDYNMANKHGFVTVDVDGPNVTVNFYEQGSMNPVNTISFSNEGGATPIPPTANDDSANTAVNTAVTINVAANDSDPNGDLDPTSVNTTCSTCAQPSYGSLSNNGDGSFTYTPSQDYQGPDSFIYEICDLGTPSLCDTALVTITVTPPNDPPVANDDSATTAEDTPVTISVAANDTDPEGNLVPTSANTDCPTCAGPSNGTLLNNNDGTFTYTPNADFNGTDSFVYEICDTLGACDTATVTITVTSVADPPVASDDSAATAEDMPVTINVAANDTDPDGNLDPTTVNTTCTGCADPGNGSLFNNGDGTFTYTPATGFTGTDSFVYEICDSGTPILCDTATVTITVNPPAVIVDAVSSGTTDGSSLTISHTTSGSDRLMLVGVSINNDNLETVSSITYTGASLSRVGFVDHQGSGGDDSRVEIWKLVAPSSGTYDVVITFSADLRHYAVAGVTTFTGVDQTDPLGDFAANYGDSSSPSLSVPSASGELVLGVFACETCTSVSFSSPGVEGWNLVAGGGNTIGAGASAEGASPEMTLSASLGNSDHWAMSGISIKSSGTPTPTNDPPVANDDSATTTEDTPVTIDVADNDSDPDGNLGPPSAIATSGPSNGTVLNNGDGTFEYMPKLDFNGPDSFIYEICDTLGACDTATVTITVTSVADPPVANDDSATTPEDTSVIIDVAANDSDPDGDLNPASASVTAGPTSGTVLNNGNGTFTYTPNPGFNGSDTFAYEICDSEGLCDTAAVSISVTTAGDNLPPTVSAGPDQTVGLSYNAILDGTVTDDGLPASPGVVTTTWTQTSGPGTVTFADASAVDTIASFSDPGSYVLRLSADDGELTGSDEMTITVNEAGGEVTTVEIRVSASSDDAEEKASGSVGLTSSDLELVYDKSDQQVGMRFNGVDIPQGATIVEAYIQFQVDETNDVATSLTIEGEDIDNAATFVRTSGNISSRPRTMASVSWVPVPWTSKGEAGPDQQTPDIASVIQEIVNRPGWSSANSLVIIITGTGERTAESYNGDSSGAALLHVEYNTGPPNHPPIANDDSATTTEDTPVIIDVAANDTDPEGDLDPTSATETSGPSNGTLLNNGDGTFDYMPNPNFNGIDSFGYQICDTFGLCDTATVTITVGPVADPPVANDDSATTTEGTAVFIDVAANDTDPDGDLAPDSASVTAGPSNGTLGNNGNGTFTYTPNPDFNGIDSFVYEICDTLGACDTATANITVTQTNDPPVAIDDSDSIPEDTVVTIDVLANDKDVDGDALTVSSATQGANGSVVVNADNTVTYTPNANYNGTDTFIYTASDGIAQSDPATVTVTVSAVNDAPVAVAQSVTTAENTSVAITLTASDVDGDSLTYSMVSAPTNGTLSGTAPNLTYQPNTNFTGSDSFGYQICDTFGLCDTATVTITVNPSAPIIVTVDAVSSGTTDGSSLTISHTTSGTDRLMLVGVSINNDNFETVSSITYNGVSLTFVNSETQSDDARVEIWKLVDPPVGTYDVVIAFSADLKRYAVAGVTTFIGVDQTDPLGTFAGNNATSNSANVTVPAASGELVLGVFSCETCNSVTFSSPIAEQWNLIAGGGNEIGAGSTIEGASPQVTINASLGARDHWALGGISIRPGSSGAPPNDPPVANDDSATTAEDTPVIIDVAANDTDPEGNLDSGSASVTASPSNGTLGNNGNGTFDYMPNPNFNGIDSFGYQICDTFGLCDTATVTITVDPVADPPVASDDSATTVENTAVTVNVAANDTDPDGNLDPTSAIVASDPSNGSLVNNGDGSFTYTPDPGFNGSDSFVYEICDDDLACDTASVSITVTQTNDPPVADDDSATTTEDTPVIINVAENDSDPEGDLDSGSASVTAAPSNGTLGNNGNGTFTYTPNADFNGSDSFGYQICDIFGLCDTATVTITVTSVPDPPTANDDSATTAEDTTVTIDVVANDTDPEGDLDPTSANTTCGTCDEPTNGLLVNNGDGTFDYTPDVGFTGSDSFVYEVCDSGTPRLCDTASVRITVTPSAPMIVEVRVSASSDDAEEKASGSVGLTSSDLELVYDGSGQTVGMRFNAVDIAQGATIVEAYIQFQVDETNDVATSLTIEGEDIDNAATFISSSANISSRPRTTAAVSWDPVPWTSRGEAGPDQQTPDIASVIQEIVDRPGWSSGNSLAVIITGTGERTAESYNGDSSGAALLHVEYSTGPPNQAPTATIIAPLDGETFTFDQSISFSGSAMDAEDGDLTPSLAWDSSLDGSIDTGGSFSSSALSLGVHTITATVTDLGGLTDVDQISISVTTAEGNLPPTVSAGPDQTIGLFENAILDGTVSDDGLPIAPGMLTTTWSQVSGPGMATFADKNAVDTTATFTAQGSYVLELSADDGELSVSDQVLITVSTASILLVPEPYASIQDAINAAQNGDIVLVSPGTYNGSLTLNKAVTLTSLYFTTGDEAYIASTILDGDNGSSVIDIPAGTPDRPTIMGFTIQNATDGIFPHAKFDFLHNIVRDMSDGIDYEAGSGGLCQFNVFEMNSDDGIDLDGSVDIVIADNIIRNNGDDGIEKRLHEYSGPTLNIIIRNNIISGNDEDGIQLIDYSDLSDRFILIEGNLIENNAMVGLGLMDNGDTREDFRAANIPERIHVFNNTFIDNDYGLTGGDNLIALNNLFVNSFTLAMKQVDGNSIAAYNLFWNNGTDEEGSNLDPDTTLSADPLLDSEFRLQPGSPAIDAGTSYFEWQSETVLDIPDTEFSGAAPDLGAYESDVE